MSHPAQARRYAGFAAASSVSGSASSSAATSPEPMSPGVGWSSYWTTQTPSPSHTPTAGHSAASATPSGSVENVDLRREPTVVAPTTTAPHFAPDRSRHQQGHLLLVCLLEKLCGLYDKNPDRGKLIFYRVVKQLSKMGFISSIPLEETAHIRAAYGDAFEALLDQASRALEPDMIEPPSIEGTVPASPVLFASMCQTANAPVSAGGASVYGKGSSTVGSASATSPTATADFFKTTRFDVEYEHLGVLGRGGFGSVAKARHKLDGLVYAVKKIAFRGSSDPAKVMREVTTLARLEHPNIVRYHGAWLELKPGVCGSTCRRLRQPRAARNDDTTSTTASCEASVRSSAAASDVGARAGSEDWATSMSASASESESMSASETGCDGVIALYQRCTCGPSPLTLHIQMQLCEITLHTWLRQRNAQHASRCDDGDAVGGAKNAPPVGLEAVAAPPSGTGSWVGMFKQLLEALRYVHRQGLIHRDVKPANVFLASHNSLHPVVKLGDFGLARDVAAQVIDTDPVEDSEALVVGAVSEGHHTRGVGTETYAAPEQLAGSVYDGKVDIFSAGFILLELLQPYCTEMERAAHFRELRNKRKLATSLLATHPRECTTVLWLTEHLPSNRPTAAQVLDDEGLLFDKHEHLGSDVEALLQAKDEEIAQLKAKIAELELGEHGEHD
eukprot:m.95395 g.95395  ORF g.95395 m.95395 type:complete len:674 (-) comp15153_c0_seq2:1545-3566(-)